jgi:hypothetical protein
MGREIKRVALDWDWPLSKTWIGYLNPYRSFPCPGCDGTGYGPEAKQLSDDWWDLARTGRKWCDKITQDEVQALVDSSRLYDFTHTWTQGPGWQRRADGYIPTADEVNAWASSRAIGHDSINHWICVRARCKRLGIEVECKRCEGHGDLWSSPEVKRLHDEWAPEEPPAGEGWQVWETVSEGSPITPVMPTAEALARHLSGPGDAWIQSSEASGRQTLRQRPTYEDALAFVTDGWAPSMVIAGGALAGPYEAARALEESTGLEAGHNP